MAPRKPRATDPLPPILFKGRQPGRPHFIPEWAESHGYPTQSDLAEALEVDKSVVSRWYSVKSPSSPSVTYQERLASLFGREDEPDCIFRHPDDDWLRRFFQGREAEEVQRIKQTLEAAFPKKANE